MMMVTGKWLRMVEDRWWMECNRYMVDGVWWKVNGRWLMGDGVR